MNQQLNEFDADSFLEEILQKKDEETPLPWAAEQQGHVVLNEALLPSEQLLGPADTDAELIASVDSEQLETDGGENPEEEPSPFNDIVFDASFRGYDRNQVDHYIDAISEDYNAICKRCDALEQENKALRRVLAAIFADKARMKRENS